MLRRSNSMSHIPLPKGVRSRSRSNSSIRSSTTTVSKDVAPSVQKQPERTSRSTLKRSMSSSALKKSSIATPTTLQPGAYQRRGTGTSTTPASSRMARSRSRSPFKFGSAVKEKTINDKKWVSEQHAKVCNFFIDRPHLIDLQVIENLNPPSIGTFVQVINVLLKQVDPKINVTQANYKEVVMNKMKILRYPLTVSNSTLKTVYTSHSLPHVMSMLGWLVDMITAIEKALSPPDDDNIKNQSLECALKYAVQRYYAYNNDEEHKEIDRAYQEKLEHIYGINNEEIKRLKQNVAKLSDGNDSQLQRIRDINNENCELKKKNESMRYEIDTFYSENEDRQLDIDQVNATLKQKIIERTEALKKKQANIKRLEKMHQEQPCTFDEKKKILRRIDELKHTLDLKKESLATKKQIKEEWGVKLFDLRKKIETEVFRLNNQLMNYTMVYPDLKILEITERDYASSDFKDVLEKVISHKKRLEEAISAEISANKVRLAQLKEGNEKIAQDIDKMCQEIETLNELEAKLNKDIKKCMSEMKLQKKAYEQERNEILKKINDMRETEPDIDSLTEKRNELVAQRTQKYQALEKYMDEQFHYIHGLYDEVMRHFKVMMEIANRVSDTVKSRAEQVFAEETKILNDLMKLKEFGTLED